MRCCLRGTPRKKSADPADDCMEIKNDPDKRIETLSKRSQQ